MARMIDADALLDAICGCFNIMEAKGVDMTTARTIVKSVLDNAPAVDGWISVKDRLPEEDVYVLAYNGVAPFIAAHTTNPSNRWYAISGFTIYATHWMPLPELPKEDNDAE